MWKLALLVAMTLSAACESPPECRPGELCYEGRPPRTLFAFDLACRENCFSLPAGTDGGRCDPECPDVRVNPGGALLDDRTLVLVDVDSLASDTRALALVYTFGYVDDAGGNAPDAWGLTLVGPRTYLAGQTDGTARFAMEVGVSEVEPSAADPELLVLTGTVSEYLSAAPGRLEILEAAPNRIAGRFFLAYQTPTAQPQGEVIGCFDLNLSDPRDEGGVSYQVFQ
jgi:hypothetical protein